MFLIDDSLGVDRTIVDVCQFANQMGHLPNSF